ncbi:MAG: sensor histidine kinase [Bacteroidia bacterium]
MLGSAWMAHTSRSSKAVLDRLELLFPERTVPSVVMEDALVALHPQGLENILFELFDNAVKFSTPNTVPRINGAKNIKSGTYAISVFNHGEGLHQKEIKHIGPMVQFNRAKQEQQGWGLGLFIAKHLIEKSGGQIQFKSKIGSHFQVFLELPLSERINEDKHASLKKTDA